MEILYGRNPVLEALRSGRRARKIVLAGGIRADDRVREITELAMAAGIPVEQSARRRLDDISHTEHHQGVAGYFHARPQLQLEQLLGQPRAATLLLALDGVQDPQNLGAIARTAEACAVDGMLLSRRHAAAITPAAAKASAGALEHVRVATVASVARALDVLREHGIRCVGLEAASRTRYDTLDYSGPVCLVLGAEGDGLQAPVRAACDSLVALPMLGRVGSLNVGAAAAALLYEVRRQRGFEDSAGAGRAGRPGGTATGPARC